MISSAHKFCSECAADKLPRFGNFIGEEVESEEASEAGEEAGDYTYDDEHEGAPSVTGQELMELDGRPIDVLTCKADG